MNLIQHSDGPWFWWNEECAGQAVADGRFLTGSVTPVANPYVFKTRIVIPPSVLADVGPLTITPYAVLELQPTVNWPGSGQDLVDHALSPAIGWVTVRNGNAPLLLASFSYAAPPTLPPAAWGDVAVPSLVNTLCGTDPTTAIRWPLRSLVLDPTKSLILETMIQISDDPGALLAGPTYPVELPVGWWVDLGGVAAGLVAAQAYEIEEAKCLYDDGVDDGSVCWLGGGSEGWNAADWAGLDRDGTVDGEADLLTQAEDCEARLVTCRQSFDRPTIGTTGARTGAWDYVTYGYSWQDSPDLLLGELAGEPFLHKTIRTIPAGMLRIGGSELLEVALGVNASGAYADPYETTSTTLLSQTIFNQLKGAVVIKQGGVVLNSLGFDYTDSPSFQVPQASETYAPTAETWWTVAGLSWWNDGLVWPRLTTAIDPELPVVIETYLACRCNDGGTASGWIVASPGDDQVPGGRLSGTVRHRRRSLPVGPPHMYCRAAPKGRAGARVG